MNMQDISFFGILQKNLKKSRDERGYGKNRKYDNEIINDWKALYRR